MEAMKERAAHKIIVAGIGPGHAAYILPAAKTAIEEADVLVGGSRALADFARAGPETLAITRDIDGVLSFIREKLAGHDVVVMVSGDPGYYSLLDALRREFSPDIIEVIPGISSLQLAFARLSLPWHDTRLLSFHGRVPTENELRYEPGTSLGLLTDAKYNSRTIPELLLDLGWPAEAELFICSRLSYGDEEIIRTTLAGAAAEKLIKHGVLVVKA